MTALLTPGTLIVAGRRLGRVVKADRFGPAHGYSITTAVEGHEGTAPHFVAADAVRVAVLGVNVCETPRGGCWCGLLHVGRPELLNNTTRRSS